MALPNKPMTALYEAVRRFLEHPQDDTGRADLEYHLGLYEADPPSGSGASWRPHPLNLHPPPTPESQAAFQRMVQVGIGVYICVCRGLGYVLYVVCVPFVC